MTVIRALPKVGLVLEAVFASFLEADQLMLGLLYILQVMKVIGSLWKSGIALKGMLMGAH